jgi:hypothetical protein
VGVPIGVCLCLAGVVYIFSHRQHGAVPVLSHADVWRVDSYGLIAIPLFILIGEIMNSGGITRRLVDLAMAFIGSVKGGPGLREHPGQHDGGVHHRLGHGAGGHHVASHGARDGESRATTRPSPPASRSMAACWAPSSRPR